MAAISRRRAVRTFSSRSSTSVIPLQCSGPNLADRRWCDCGGDGAARIGAVTPLRIPSATRGRNCARRQTGAQERCTLGGPTVIYHGRVLGQVQRRQHVRGFCQARTPCSRKSTVFKGRETAIRRRASRRSGTPRGRQERPHSPSSRLLLERLIDAEVADLQAQQIDPHELVRHVVAHREIEVRDGRFSSTFSSKARGIQGTSSALTLPRSGKKIRGVLRCSRADAYFP
jgi:hypothetical protein